MGNLRQAETPGGGTVSATPSPPGPRRANALQQAQRAETRERLIDGAHAVFARIGYAHANIGQVLAEARVSRASLYAHFTGKAALAAAIAERFAPVWEPLYDELAGMAGPDLPALEAWCARHVAIYRDHQPTCIILTQAAAIEPALYWRLAAAQDQTIARLARGRLGLAHLATDPAAHTRAALALSQIDHACYFLAVRHWNSDPAAGIAAMAAGLLGFLQSERDRSSAISHGGL